MKHLTKLLITFCLLGLETALQGQNTIPATGGNVTGSGGTVSYSIGQVTYQTLSGINGTVSQGVQQPYEISVITAIENTGGITLEYIVYPNPTKDIFKLIIKPFDNENIRFKLYDLNGIPLQDKKIESSETEISLEIFSSSLYFLKVIKDNQEVKVFKIIKN